MAQPDFLQMNALVGDSIYQSDEVIAEKNEWVASCVYYFRDGWETFSIKTMPSVLAKAQVYNENKTLENATFEFQSEEYDFRLPHDTGSVRWAINFGKRCVYLTINENVRVKHQVPSIIPSTSTVHVWTS